MTPSPPAVKPGRTYDSTRRQERARRVRDGVVEVAEQRFLRDGYAPTSIASIAADAGVSVDTIYKAYGGKAGLMRAIHRRALEGGGSVPAEQRSDRLQADEPDPRKIIEGWGRFVTEIAPRALPIVLMIRSAVATDPQLQSLVDEIDADRYRRMTDNASRLHERGHLRPGLGVGAAADILWTYSSAELYELLVIRRGMSIKRYGRFVSEALAAALLPHNRAH